MRHDGRQSKSLNCFCVTAQIVQDIIFLAPTEIYLTTVERATRIIDISVTHMIPDMEIGEIFTPPESYAQHEGAGIMSTANSLKGGIVLRLACGMALPTAPAACASQGGSRNCAAGAMPLRHPPPVSTAPGGVRMRLGGSGEGGCNGNLRF